MMMSRDPITTAFRCLFPCLSGAESCPVVTRAKCCIFPVAGAKACPIPFFVVAATMSATQLIDENECTMCQFTLSRHLLRAAAVDHWISHSVTANGPRSARIYVTQIWHSGDNIITLQ